MSLFQFNVVSAQCGSANPYSPTMEGLLSRTLEGVQSASISVSIPRQDAYGWDGAGGDEIVERPRAELNLGWVFTSGANESAIGLATSPSGTVPALSPLNAERNYYLRINQDNVDSLSRVDPSGTILSLGNAVITRYDFSAQLNQPNTVTLTAECLNALVQQNGDSGQISPAIEKIGGTALTGTYALPAPINQTTNFFGAMPSAIQLSFPTGSALGVAMSGQNSCPVDSFGFSVDLPRSEVKTLGWAYPEVRPIQWPVAVSIRADVSLNKFQWDQINRYACFDSGHSIVVGFKSACSSPDSLQFRFDGAKLDSESVSLSVGGGVSRASLSWHLRISDLNRAWPNFYLNAPATAYSSILVPVLEYQGAPPAPAVISLATPSYLSVLSGPGQLSGNSVLLVGGYGGVMVRATAANGNGFQDIVVNAN